MKLTIKRLKRGDWKRYRKRLINIEINSFGSKDRTPLKFFKELIDDCEPYSAIFYYKGKTVGYYVANVLEDSGEDLKVYDKHFGKHDSIYLLVIGVHKDYQHCGIGTQMMNDILNIASSRYKRISLHTKNPNFKKLIHKYGFKFVRHNIWTKPRRVMDYYVKRLK